MVLRVWFEHTRYAHWGQRSGYTQFVRELDPQRYEANLHATVGGNNHTPSWLKQSKPLLQRRVDRTRMPWYTVNDLTSELDAFAECLKGRFDIVHFLDGEHSGQMLPRLVRMFRLSAIKTVATFHQPPEIAREVVNGESLRWLDQVVLMSPSQLPFFRQFVSEEKLRVILHGVNTEFFRPATERPPKERISCITVGHHLRDWKAFAAVALRMSEIDFHVVTIAKASRELPKLPNVRMHVRIDDAKLAELYRSADILFLPLSDSTANNALLEAMASGLPVVVSDIEAVRTYLGGGGGGVLVDNREGAFERALRDLARDPVRRRQMGAQSRARAEELAWPALVQHYERLYDGLVA